ncbi:MAG: hypothetical protein PHY92_04705 [Alphaproteobacteria bacterium]|nr:hypothetical protein [Alphaproteobacteria bacterium]
MSLGSVVIQSVAKQLSHLGFREINLPSVQMSGVEKNHYEISRELVLPDCRTSIILTHRIMPVSNAANVYSVSRTIPLSMSGRMGVVTESFRVNTALKGKKPADVRKVFAETSRKIADQILANALSGCSEELTDSKNYPAVKRPLPSIYDHFEIMGYSLWPVKRATPFVFSKRRGPTFVIRGKGKQGGLMIVGYPEGWETPYLSLDVRDFAERVATLGFSLR